jgi:hypothetical protein
VVFPDPWNLQKRVNSVYSFFAIKTMALGDEELFRWGKTREVDERLYLKEGIGQYMWGNAARTPTYMGKYGKAVSIESVV